MNSFIRNRDFKKKFFPSWNKIETGIFFLLFNVVEFNTEHVC